MQLAVRTRWVEALVGIPAVVVGARPIAAGLAFTFSNAILAVRALSVTHRELVPVGLARDPPRMRSLLPEGARLMVRGFLGMATSRAPLVILGARGGSAELIGALWLWLHTSSTLSSLLAPTLGVGSAVMARAAAAQSQDGVRHAPQLRLLALAGMAGALPLALVGAPLAVAVLGAG